MAPFVAPYAGCGMVAYTVCCGTMDIVGSSTYAGTEGAYTIGGGSGGAGDGVQTYHVMGMVCDCWTGP